MEKKQVSVKDRDAGREAECENDREQKARRWIPKTYFVGSEIRARGNNKAVFPC